MSKKGKRKHERTAVPPFAVPSEVAGLAAAAMKQINTPAFQQLIAGALGAAAQAMARRASGQSSPSGTEPPVRPEERAASERPAPPVPPVPPEQPARSQAYGPKFADGSVPIPPEAAQAIQHAAQKASEAIERMAGHASSAIERAAAEFDRWAETRVKPPGRPSATPASGD